jgi:hypothetical protein
LLAYLENTLILVYKVAKKLYPKIANFLPTSRKELEKWMMSFRRGDKFGTAALKEISLGALEMNAQCLSYAMQDPSTTSGVIATGQFVKGATIIASPLLLVEHPAGDDQRCAEVASEDDHECRLSNDHKCRLSNAKASCSPSAEKELTGITRSNCLTQEGLPFSLCSLSLVSRIHTVETPEKDSSGLQPNVEFQWSAGNRHNADALKKPPMEVTEVSPMLVYFYGMWPSHLNPCRHCQDVCHAVIARCSSAQRHPGGRNAGSGRPRKFDGSAYSRSLEGLPGRTRDLVNVAGIAHHQE